MSEIIKSSGQEEMEALPWYEDVKGMGIPIHNCGRYSRPICPEHGWIFIRKFGKYRWGCTFGLREIHIISEKFLEEVGRTSPQLLIQWAKEKRCWSNCHLKIEYMPVKPEGDKDA